MPTPLMLMHVDCLVGIISWSNWKIKNFHPIRRQRELYIMYKNAKKSLTRVEDNMHGRMNPPSQYRFNVKYILDNIWELLLLKRPHSPRLKYNPNLPFLNKYNPREIVWLYVLIVEVKLWLSRTSMLYYHVLGHWPRNCSTILRQLTTIV